MDRRFLAIAISIGAAAGLSPPAASETYQLDPFAQATEGFPTCPIVAPRVVSAEQMRNEAHARAERGTRCAMEGTCEPGGAYRRDPEITVRVVDAIRSERRFARTSIYVTTSRKWITLEGCVRSRTEQRALVEFVKRQPGVERVFDETTIGVRKTSR